MLRLFLGSGGVGKSTLAAASAVRLAESGSRVLVVSLDQSHSLGDVLGLTLTRDDGSSEPMTVAPGLDVLEIDTLALLEARYRSLGSILAVAGAGHEHGVHFGAIEPEELMGVPGAQEMLGLHRVVELVEDNAWDTVILDLPGAADALRTLQLPDLTYEYLERIWPVHDRIVAGTGTDPRLTLLVAVLERISARASSIRDVLTDAALTTATVVVTPESVAVAGMSRTLSALALNGVAVSGVIVNRTLPQLNSASVGLIGAHPAVFWFEGWRSAEQDVLARIRLVLGNLDCVEVHRATAEPVGLASLAALAAHMDVRGPAVERTVADARGTVALESGSGLESVYAMSMPVPVVDASTLTLGRVEDDLIVGVDGYRRRIHLAPVLRRCIVFAAELDGGDLVVRFRPDASVWPT